MILFCLSALLSSESIHTSLPNIWAQETLFRGQRKKKLFTSDLCLFCLSFFMPVLAPEGLFAAMSKLLYQAGGTESPELALWTPVPAREQHSCAYSRLLGRCCGSAAEFPRLKAIFWSLRNSLCPCNSLMFYFSILEVLPGAWLLGGSLCLKQSGMEGRLWVWYLKVALMEKGAWSVIVAPNCYWLAWGLMLKWWGVLTWQVIH